MYFAIGAAFEPCSECSAKTTPAISGFFAGAKKTKKPWSRRSLVVLPARGLALVRDDLRRAGLAGHVVADDLGAAARCRRR